MRPYKVSETLSLDAQHMYFVKHQIVEQEMFDQVMQSNRTVQEKERQMNVLTCEKVSPNLRVD